MAKLAVELDINDDDGSIGGMPDQLQRLFDSRIKDATRRGREKAEEQLRQEIEAAKGKAGDDPSASERAKNLEQELSKLRQQEAERTKNFDEAKRLIEERHAAELGERSKQIELSKSEIDRRTSRIRQLVASEVQIAALKHGAREESLAELNVLLGARIGLDDKELLPFVTDPKDASKSALDADGKPMTIEGLVQQYLTDHPHHKAAASGRGGRAAGGRSLAGGTSGEGSAFADAVERVAQTPSVNSVADAFKRMGERKSA